MITNSNASLIINTILALLAFAGNSVLCRLALAQQQIDAVSFTNIRLISAALALYLILKIQHRSTPTKQEGSWLAALALFTYAIFFSVAYVNLDTGSGALILFGAVQITMIVMSYLKGNKLSASEWLGVIIATSGLVYLLLPSLGTPSVVGFIFMVVSGIAWAVYTLLGSSAQSALSATTFNFIRTIPLIIIVSSVIWLLSDLQIHWTYQGILLAMISGVVTSGLGYTIWYLAVPHLKATQAGVLQLLVPVFAAIGGVVFSNEQISIDLVISSILVLAGVLLVLKTKKER